MRAGNHPKITLRPLRPQQGFTLVELVVSMAIVGLVMAGLLTIFMAQDRIHKAQEESAATQQNVRGVMFLMKKELRMAGYDLNRSDERDFGIIDVRSRNLGDSGAGAYPSILFTAADYDDGGPKAFRYSVMDADGDGDLELARQFLEDNSARNRTAEGNLIAAAANLPGGGSRIIMANHIEAFGIAFAVDDNQDGEPDVVDPGNNDNIIWAIDTDNDNQLDLNIDINGDGAITIADDTNNDNLITAADDTGDAVLNPAIGLDRIHSVRIWVLGKNDSADKNYTESAAYVVGNRIVETNDHFRRRFLTSVVRSRNLGL